jgi:hypothetical protein
MEITPLKCSVCGGVIENYHGQKEVKCSYCGVVQEIETDSSAEFKPVKNKTTLTAAIVILVLIVLFAGVSFSLDIGTMRVKKNNATRNSLTKDTVKQTPQKVDNRDPLGK